LHVEQSLASIDFKDFEPGIVAPKIFENPDRIVQRLVRNPLFMVELWKSKTAHSTTMKKVGMQIIGAVSGTGTVRSASAVRAVQLSAGEFCLIPASLTEFELTAESDSSFLCVTGGQR
jgi:mannose-6-phosphate isomerase class I